MKDKRKKNFDKIFALKPLCYLISSLNNDRQNYHILYESILKKEGISKIKEVSSSHLKKGMKFPSEIKIEDIRSTKYYERRIDKTKPI